MKFANSLLLLLALLSAAQAERWDILLTDSTAINAIERVWRVSETLFVVIEDDFRAVEIGDIQAIKQYREVKAPFNLHRAFVYTQLTGLGGVVAGVVLGTRGSGDQGEKMRQGLKSSLTYGLICGGCGFIAGGIIGGKRIMVVYHDLDRMSPARKVGKIRQLLEQEK